MAEVAVIGAGQTRVGEHWDKSARELAVEAVLAALRDAHTDQVDAIYVGNMLSVELCGQAQLGSLIADALGWHGVEAFTVQAACSSGAAAMRAGCLAVAAGQSDRVAVLGIEKITDRAPEAATAALSTTSDADYEAENGITLTALGALLMRRYMHEYDLVDEDFACFPLNAHANAESNPYAMFRRSVTATAYAQARKVADPISVLDSAPICDGAAAVILSRSDKLNGNGARAVRVAASAVATDSVALGSRKDPLWLSAVEMSAHRAYAQARVQPQDVNLFELHDALTIMAPLSLEAAGFTPRGTGVYAAREGQIGIHGEIPISTMGGLKARGHPVGASGIYQIVECVEQLRGEAGANQVPDAHVAMAQSLGGIGATAVTHILVN